MSRWLQATDNNAENSELQELENIVNNESAFLAKFQGDLPEKNSDAWFTLVSLLSDESVFEFNPELKVKCRELGHRVLDTLEKNGHVVDIQGSPFEGTYLLYVDDVLVGNN